MYKPYPGSTQFAISTVDVLVPAYFKATPA